MSRQRFPEGPRPHVIAAAMLSIVLAATAVALAGCGSTRSGGRDGPPLNPPADLIRTPDAEPRIEPIRSGGPNKPYDVLGRHYVPVAQDEPFRERGLASWYGRKFQGLPTSSGEPYDLYAMTAAHPTLPIPSYARIRNPANGREVIVRVNDRGPFHPGRIVDLSYTAALKLGLLRGVAPVELERLTFDEIRTGAWRRGGDDGTRLAVSPRSAVPLPTTRVDGSTVVAVAAASIDASGSDRPDAPGSDDPSAGAADPAASISPPAVTSEPVAPVAVDKRSNPAATATSMATSSARAPAPGFWVQIGAFRVRGGAEIFQQRIGADFDWLKPLLTVFDDAPFYRLQAGPYASRDEALGAAGRVRDDLKLVPVVVEQR